MERWQFIESPSGAWYWLCSEVLSNRTRTSAVTFSTRHECVADAMNAGYRKSAFNSPTTPVKLSTTRRRASPASRYWRSV